MFLCEFNSSCHTKPSSMIITRMVCIVIMLLTMNACTHIGKGKIPKGEPAKAIPEIEDSALNFQVNVSIQDIINQIEDVIPTCTPGLGYCDKLIIQCEKAWANKLRHYPGDNPIIFWVIGFKYSIWSHSGLSMSLDENTLTTRLPLRYHIKVGVEKPPWNPTSFVQVGSCGHGDDTPDGLGAKIGLDSTFDRDDREWFIESETEFYTGDFNPRCQATIIDKDVTDKVERVIRKQLSRISEKIDKETPELTNVRSITESMWKKIQEPESIRNGVWFVLNPKQVYFSNFDSKDNFISFRTSLVASPKIIIGDKPDQNYIDLHEHLFHKNIDKKFQIMLEGSLPFNYATDKLKQAVIGKYIIDNPSRFPNYSFVINIVDAEVFGDGGSIILRLTAEGGVWPFEEWGLWGNLYLIGTPNYEPNTNTFSISDLHFTSDTSNSLAKARFPSLEGEFLSQLIEKSQWELDESIEQTRQRLNEELNSIRIDNQTSIQAKVDMLDPQGVWITPEGLRAIVKASGEVNINSNIEPPSDVEGKLECP